MCVKKSWKRVFAAELVLAEPTEKDSVGSPSLLCAVVPVKTIWWPGYKSSITFDDLVTVTPSIVRVASAAVRVSITAVLLPSVLLENVTVEATAA